MLGWGGGVGGGGLPRPQEHTCVGEGLTNIHPDVKHQTDSSQHKPDSLRQNRNDPEDFS